MHTTEKHLPRRISKQCMCNLRLELPASPFLVGTLAGTYSETIHWDMVQCLFDRVTVLW